MTYSINTVVLFVVNTISALTCLALFYVYSRISNKSIGVKMVFVMSIADFIFHIARIVYFLILDPFEEVTALFIFIFFLEVFCMRFAIFWGCSMAFFLYRLLRLRDVSSLNGYFGRSLITVFLITTILSVL